MKDSEKREWWTIPQAAVWIRTRDLHSVRSLDDEAKAYLSAADGPFPDSVAASLYLLKAFRLGRLEARGWPRGMRAAQVGAPVWTSFWIDAALCAGDAGIEARHPAQQTIEGLLVDAADVTDHWVSPATLLTHGQLTLQRAAGRLEEDRLDWILAHPDVAVTGLNGSSDRVSIDRRVFASCTIDPITGAIATSDGRLAWSAVTLELATAAVVTNAAAIDGTSDATDEATMDAWLRGEMVRRRRVGEPKNRDTMVVAMMTEFRGQLSKKRAKKLFAAVPKDLKEKPGPRAGSRRNQDTGPKDSARCRN
jgi:hypothetical protein